MKTANIAELKNRLSVYLNEVKRGGEVLVSERNVPFAKIVPLKHTENYDLETLDLVAKGKLALPKEPLPESFWDDERPNVPVSRILEIIREDRDAR